jgi:hypothetical protein
VTGGWRKMHVIHDLYSLTNIIEVIIPRMKLAGHEACIRKKRKKWIQAFCGKT